MTKLNYCDICTEFRGRENIKVVSYEVEGQGFHINYCRKCWDMHRDMDRVPDISFDDIEDDREFYQQAVEKAKDILKVFHE